MSPLLSFLPNHPHPPPHPLIKIPPHVTKRMASVKPWQYFDAVRSPFLLPYSFEVHLAAQGSVPLPTWWECLVTGRLWPALPRTSHFIFPYPWEQQQIFHQPGLPATAINQT